MRARRFAIDLHFDTHRIADIGFDKHFRVNHEANEFVAPRALNRSGVTSNSGCTSLTAYPPPFICI